MLISRNQITNQLQ